MERHRSARMPSSARPPAKPLHAEWAMMRSSRRCPRRILSGRPPRRRRCSTISPSGPQQLLLQCQRRHRRGIAAAVGVQIAHPAGMVAVIGDGSAMYRSRPCGVPPTESAGGLHHPTMPASDLKPPKLFHCITLRRQGFHDPPRTSPPSPASSAWGGAGRYGGRFDARSTRLLAWTDCPNPIGHDQELSGKPFRTP